MSHCLLGCKFCEMRDGYHNNSCCSGRNSACLMDGYELQTGPIRSPYYEQYQYSEWEKRERELNRLAAIVRAKEEQARADAKLREKLKKNNELEVEYVKAPVAEAVKEKKHA